jgi:hypothetical protein
MASAGDPKAKLITIKKTAMNRAPPLPVDVMEMLHPLSL